MISTYSRSVASKASTVAKRTVVAVAKRTGVESQRQGSAAVLALAASGCAALGLWSSIQQDNENHFTSCAAPRSNIPLGGDVISMGAPTAEAATGILFPQLCNGYHFVGCGVRIKYGFIKVYAVGTYVDFLSMSAIKKLGKEKINEALLDPNYPRVIRIVMNRDLSVDKFTSAIVEALEPRMNGQDLDKLEEFKKLNPPVDLIRGAEIEMTIRGDTMLYKNAMGGVGRITSHVFTKAMCDVYYGSDPVSPKHKEMVLDAISKL